MVSKYIKIFVWVYFIFYDICWSLTGLGTQCTTQDHSTLQYSAGLGGGLDITLQYTIILHITLQYTVYSRMPVHCTVECTLYCTGPVHCAGPVNCTVQCLYTVLYRACTLYCTGPVHCTLQCTRPYFALFSADTGGTEGRAVPAWNPPCTLYCVYFLLEGRAIRKISNI